MSWKFETSEVMNYVGLRGDKNMFDNLWFREITSWQRPPSFIYSAAKSSYLIVYTFEGQRPLELAGQSCADMTGEKQPLQALNQGPKWTCSSCGNMATNDLHWTGVTEKTATVHSEDKWEWLQNAPGKNRAGKKRHSKYAAFADATGAPRPSHPVPSRPRDSERIWFIRKANVFLRLPVSLARLASAHHTTHRCLIGSPLCRYGNQATHVYFTRWLYTLHFESWVYLRSAISTLQSIGATDIITRGHTSSFAPSCFHKRGHKSASENVTANSQCILLVYYTDDLHPESVPNKPISFKRTNIFRWYISGYPAVI